MPEISRFYGDEIIVDIATLTVIAGKLPSRATGMVIEWATQHQAELRADWDRARNMIPLEEIDPLP